MVRPSDLKRVLWAALTIAISTPACAETPLDWYIDLKREAKYARIAADQGALPQDLRKFGDAASRLIGRLDDWDRSPVREDAKRRCLVAAQRLVGAVSKATAQMRVGAINASEPDRDACLAAIQRR